MILMKHLAILMFCRLINNVNKSSILDHLYVTDATVVKNINSCKPYFGDHLLIFFDVCTDNQEPVESYKRDWRNYSKLALCQALSCVEWDFVQTVSKIVGMFLKTN